MKNQHFTILFTLIILTVGIAVSVGCCHDHGDFFEHDHCLNCVLFTGVLCMLAAVVAFLPVDGLPRSLVSVDGTPRYRAAVPPVPLYRTHYRKDLYQRPPPRI